MNQVRYPEKASIKIILYLCLISTVFSQALPVQGQITPDNTLLSEASQLNQNLLINGALIDEIGGGAIRGSNLFHSFSEFNIQEGQQVYFVNPNGVENILTRITGGNASNILGTLGVEGAANLFLINPNGILFGQNAQLDVQGSFVGTTANGVQFGNQGNFSATNPQAPPLLTVNPSALLFNQINPSAGIQNNSIAPAGIDPAGFGALGLRVPDGKSLLLVGGNVSMDGGQLNAYGGRVELGGLAAPGNINLVFNGDNLRLGFPENLTRADVLLTNRASVYVEGAGGGDIVVNARNLDILNRSLLFAGIGEGLGTPETVAGDITLNATGEIKIVNSGSVNLVRWGSKGNGGNITIDSGDFSLRDSAQISASTYGQGNAGNVTVNAKNAVSLVYAAIFSTVETGGIGKGGNVDINAATLSLTDGAQLLTLTRGASDTQPAGRGDAGDVNIQVTGAVNIAGEKNGFSTGVSSSVETGTVGNGGNIIIDSGDFSLQDGALLLASTYGQGNAGNVTVSAKNAVSLVNAYIISTVETGGIGKGGNIDINAATLSLTDGAQLLTLTRGASDTQPAGRGDAGDVNIQVTGAVDITGGKNGFFTGVSSSVNTGAVGNGGNITINSGEFSLRDGAQISASTSGQGNAGNVTVSAKNAVSLVYANIISTVEAGGIGKGGNIDINAATLSLTDGAQLLTLTRGASDTQPAGRGDAGDVNIQVTGAVDITGGENGFSTGVSSSVDTGTVGNGGKITLNTNIFRISDGALLDARTANDQKGGDITVNTSVFEALNGGQLTTTTSSNGRAGKISVNATDKVIISGTDFNYNNRITQFPNRVGNIGANSGLFVSSTSSGITGDIEVNSPKITLDNQGKLNAESASGNGGNINLNSDLLLLRRNSQISTNAGTEKLGGDGGNININSKFIVAIPDENSDITANAYTGIGGNVKINSQGIFGIEARTKPTEKNDITASSELGVPGAININTPDTSSIQNSFTGLSQNVIDTNALIANSCISRGTKRQENSFTITGSGALRNSPGDVLISAYTTGDVRSVEATSRPWKKGDPIIEPQGLYRLPNGQLILSRSC